MIYENAPLVLCGIASRDSASSISDQLDRMGCNCYLASDFEDFTSTLNQRNVSLAILGANFNYRAALRLCQREHAKRVPTILLAEGGAMSPSSVVQAMKLGAEDVIEVPYDPSQLRKVADLARAGQSIPDSINPKREPLPQSHDRVKGYGLSEGEHDTAMRKLEGLLVGRSAALRRVCELIAGVADTSAPVMITGESGTGKELVARAIHQLSPRVDAPFVPVNMAAVPNSLAESLLFGHEKGAFTNAVKSELGWCTSADQGTLFLDEIGEMDLTLQPKLLRFLQEGTVHAVGAKQSRKVDVRVITATNRDPREIVRDRILREDLYFRLHVVPIHLPPLRERPEDIAPLAELFLNRAATRHHRAVERFSPDALAELESANWPGNVRQLENLVERLVIFAREAEIQTSDFPMDFHGDSVVPRPMGLKAAKSTLNGASHAEGGDISRLTRMEEKERSAIIEALQQAEGHVVNASLILGIGQATLYRKIKKYAIPKWKRRAFHVTP